METKEYKDLVEYIDMAKKTIRAFSNRICPGICNKMSSSEDAIADIAYAMMCADWKYDKDRKGKHSQQSKTKYSYRNQCAIWAIQTYIKKELKHKTLYINNILDKDGGLTFSDMLADDNQKEPLEDIITEEKNSLESELVQNIFDSNILTQSQKDKLRLYYIEGLSLAKIGRIYGITREAVRQTIKNSISKLQENLV
jgi:RNA polymerase sigma factor (sigma-70 family)